MIRVYVDLSAATSEELEQVTAIRQGIQLAVHSQLDRAELPREYEVAVTRDNLLEGRSVAWIDKAFIIEDVPEVFTSTKSDQA